MEASSGLSLPSGNIAEFTMNPNLADGVQPNPVPQSPQSLWHKGKNIVIVICSESV